MKNLCFKRTVVGMVIIIFILTVFPLIGEGSQEEAEDYPKKNITFAIDGSAGGGSDTWSRLFFSIADKYIEPSFVGVNKPGGSSSVAFAYSLKQAADGYTLCTVTPNFIVTPLRQELGFDYKDFDPVCTILKEGKVIFTKPGKYETLQEAIEYAKNNPGKQSWATYGTGTDEHIILHMISNEENLDVEQVAFGGSGEVVTAVVGGHVDLGIAKPSLALGQIKAGQLKPLAVDGYERTGSLPDVPTLGEMGYDISIPTWRGLVVPKGTPQERIDILLEVFEKVVDDPEFQTKLIDKLKYDVFYMKGEELEDFLDQEHAKFKKVLTEMGFETY